MKPCLAAIAAFIAALLLLPGLGLAEDDEGAVDEKTDSMRRFVFFAVLEGLFEDGVQKDVVEAFLVSGENEPGFFVPGCPICQPACDAMTVYARSPEILGWLKGEPPRPGFGLGWNEGELQAFRDAAREERLVTLEGLIAGWVERHRDRLRLLPEEWNPLQARLQQGMKEGMRGLTPGFGKRCAVCDGACRP